MIMKYLFIMLSLITVVGAEDTPFRVSTPNESSNRKAVAHIKPEISGDLSILIDHLREPKDYSFIVSGDAKAPLKWRVEYMTVISQELVAICYTEGHVEVFAIYARNHKDKSWDLKSQIHGTISVKSFVDPPKKNPG